MKCTSCGAEFPSDQLRCPYCNTVNEQAMKLAKDLQQYDKEYEEHRDEMLRDGETIALRKITLGIGLGFLLIVAVFGAYVGVLKYRISPARKTSSIHLEENKKQVDEYLKNGDYMRGEIMAYETDPTNIYFRSYPEHKDELEAILQYSFMYSEVARAVSYMDRDNRYYGFSQYDARICKDLYDCKDSEIKDELVEEVENYLRNLYQLTDEEIEQLKLVEDASQFTLDGRKDYEEVSRERMEERFEK